MSCQRSYWFLVLLTKQLIWDNAGNGEATINNEATAMGKTECLDNQIAYCQKYKKQSGLRDPAVKSAVS